MKKRLNRTECLLTPRINLNTISNHFIKDKFGECRS